MKIYFFIITFFLFLSCTKDTYEKKELTVNLTQILNKDIAFDERYSIIPISTIKDQYPDYYKNLLAKYHSNEFDDLIISTFNTNTKNFHYHLFKDGFITKNEFEALNVDTFLYKNTIKQAQLNVAGINKDGKQILIADINNNFDFSDDKSFYFEDDFRFGARDLNVIDTLPLLEFNYWDIEKSEILKFSRKVKIYPNSRYKFFYPTDDEILDKSRLLISLEDFWHGEVNVNDYKFDVAAQGFNSKYLKIYIKPKDQDFNADSYKVNYNYSYNLNDTIAFNEKLFIIDSISNNFSQLHIKGIDFNFLEFKSDKPGYIINNFKLKGINGEVDDLYNLIDKNKYTLLDFWGTWCKPCLELTPELKNIQKSNRQKLDLVSIAFDDDTTVVKDYINKNLLEWPHFFENRKNRKITKKLSVKEFPSFFLLNQDGKIVYRGIGKEGLKAIESHIEKL